MNVKTKHLGMMLPLSLCVAFSYAQSPNSINGHEYVDLGLSVKWATCNVGAASPSDYGNYYAWGEAKPKSEYKYSNSVMWGGSMPDIVGDSQYDTARVNWGGTWRLPTSKEVDELISKCKCVRVSQGGHDGMKITGPNGNSIFLPAGGFHLMNLPDFTGQVGGFWSSTPNGNESYVYTLAFIGGDFLMKGESDCACGMNVRPVLE